MLLSRNRLYRREQRVIALEVAGEAVPQPLGRLLGLE